MGLKIQLFLFFLFKPQNAETGFTILFLIQIVAVEHQIIAGDNICPDDMKLNEIEHFTIINLDNIFIFLIVTGI